LFPGQDLFGDFQRSANDSVILSGGVPECLIGIIIIPDIRLPVADQCEGLFGLDIGLARAQDLPETERAAREVLSLPVHPALTTDDLAEIVTAVNAAAAAGS